MDYQTIIFNPTNNSFIYIYSHLNDKTATLIVGDINFSILKVELRK